MKIKTVNRKELKPVFRLTKNFVLPILIILIILFSISYVSAYKRLCLSYGQSIPNNENPIWTCWHDKCILCVTDNNYPTHPARCNDIQGCEILGDTDVDLDPPELVINSPKDNQVFSSRMVLFDLETNEPASYYYKDNNIGVWRRLTANADSYFNEISFKDGLHSITIKAVDRNENEVEESISFYVDSIKPKIIKTGSKEEFEEEGFTNGNFIIEFIEENPKILTFNYGVLGNIRTQNLDLNDCKYERKKHSCEVRVDLSEYNGQIIKYWFELEDITGRVVKSRQVLSEVDTTLPKILNDNFWIQGILKSNKYIYFDLLIEEENFRGASYRDNSELKPREKTLCSSLKDGRCQRKVTFRKGNHLVYIKIVDKAGNEISERIEFDVV